MTTETRVDSEPATAEVATPIPAAKGVDRRPLHVSRPTCWCQPKINYEDPISGDRVYVHQAVVA